MLSICKLFERQRQKTTYNAPQFIYSILYNTEPPKNMGGRDVCHETRDINGISIDKEIPKMSIIKLNQIKEIEPRSSCQGQDESHPTFFIFRLRENSTIENVKNVVKKLNKCKDIKAGFNLGNRNQYRIGVTTELWYTKNDKEKFNKWWKVLPDKIKTSVF